MSKAVAKKPSVRLERWRYYGKDEHDPQYRRSHVLTGLVFGHPSRFLIDGEPTTTSVIQGVHEGYVETQNSLYWLGEWSGEGPTKDELFTLLGDTA